VIHFFQARVYRAHFDQLPRHTCVQPSNSIGLDKRFSLIWLNNKHGSTFTNYDSMYYPRFSFTSNLTVLDLVLNGYSIP